MDVTAAMLLALDPCLIYDRQTKEWRQAAEPAYNVVTFFTWNYFTSFFFCLFCDCIGVLFVMAVMQANGLVPSGNKPLPHYLN